MCLPPAHFHRNSCGRQSHTTRQNRRQNLNAPQPELLSSRRANCLILRAFASFQAGEYSHVNTMFSLILCTDSDKRYRSAGELVEDGLRRRGPDERRAFRVVGFDVARDGALQIGDGFEGAAPYPTQAVRREIASWVNPTRKPTASSKSKASLRNALDACSTSRIRWRYLPECLADIPH